MFRAWSQGRRVFSDFLLEEPDPSEFLNLEEGRLGGVHAGGSRRDEPVDNGGPGTV